MKHKFACADFTFPLLKHEDSLRVIRMLGCEGADIGLFQDRSHIQPFEQFKDVKGNATKLKGVLDDIGIQPADVFLQTDLDFEVTAINHPDKKVRDMTRDMYKKLLDYTAILGGDHVTVLPGVFFSSEEKEASFARSVEEMNWRIDLAASYGIAFAVEGHVGSLMSNPAEIKTMLDAMPKLKLTLDFTHFIKQGYSTEDALGLVKYANHFHARGAKNGVMQTVISENEIDYDAIVREMVATGYDGWVGLEYTWTEWENNNRTDNISESVLLKEKLTKLFDKYEG